MSEDDAAHWVGASPEQRAQAAAQALGAVEFATWCADVLGGRSDLLTDSLHDPVWIAGGAWTSWGPPATWAERGMAYWPRVWAARSLLHAWHPTAEAAVVGALGDDAWRVREMAAKVAAAHDVAAADRCARLAVDPVPRVRAAAARVIGAHGEAEHASAIVRLLRDPDGAVRAAAERAAALLEVRLDRSFTDLTN